MAGGGGGGEYTSDVEPRCILKAPSIRNTVEHLLLHTYPRRIGSLFRAEYTIPFSELAARRRDHNGTCELHTRDPWEGGLLWVFSLGIGERRGVGTNMLILPPDLQKVEKVCSSGADLDEVFIVLGLGVGES